MSKYIVRYGSMRSLGLMGVRGDEIYRRGMEVIVRSNRGLEIGQVLCEAHDDALSHLDDPPTGQILREVSNDDANEVSHLENARKKNIQTCQKYVDQLGLEMSLVDVEQLFGGERMIVFYLAEERVDFRDLVKLLASEFQTRIEMKQIGVRDEAKLLADYGDCGQPVCCNNHLVSMPPVSMRMAKLQKATLDPTKISGRCGRLKCCLRYEFDHYEAVQKSLPRIGAQIVTRDGKAKVIAQQLLVEQLLIETEDHRRMLIDASEVLSVISKSNDKKDPSKRNSSVKDRGKQQSSNAVKEKDSNRSLDSTDSDQVSSEREESEAKIAPKKSRSRRRGGRRRKGGRGEGNSNQPPE